MRGGGCPGRGCSPAPLRSARSGTGRREGAGGLSGRAGAAAMERVELQPPGSSAHSASRGLFVSCESRKPL